jgi:L-rhamnose-H+ transport protein
MVGMGSGLGIFLAVAAGLMVGNCMLPLNYLRKWRWENAWIIFTLVALVLVPWILAFLRVPNLLSVYSNVTTPSFMIPFLFGAGWGVAQVLFGLAVIRAGMALSFAITIGLSAALGSLIPILLRHPEALLTGRGLVLLLGQLLMVTGVVVCCWAGRRREREQKAEAATTTARSYMAGVSLAALAGLLAPMLNYALAFGDNLIHEALLQHALSADAPYAVWPIALAGGAVPNLLYPLWLLQRNKTWANFRPIWPEITLGMIMGLLWMGSVAIYGTATTLLGVLGASIGWSIYQICIIFMSNGSGWIAGEWKGVSPASKVLLFSGLVLLGLATVAITYGNH